MDFQQPSCGQPNPLARAVDALGMHQLNESQMYNTNRQRNPDAPTRNQFHLQLHPTEQLPPDLQVNRTTPYQPPNVDWTPEYLNLHRMNPNMNRHPFPQEWISQYNSFRLPIINHQSRFPVQNRPWAEEFLNSPNHPQRQEPLMTGNNSMTGNNWANEYTQQQEETTTQWVDDYTLDNVWKENEDRTNSDNNEYEFQENNPYADSAEPFSEGVRLIREGRLTDAILAFEACVKRNPNNAEGWRYLGQCCADNEQDIKALNALNRSIQLDPYNIEALLLLAVSETNELQQMKAIIHLRSWIENHPDYQKVVRHGDPNMGLYGSHKDLLQQVIQLYQRASQMNPNDSDLFVSLGVLYNLSNDHNAAIQVFKKAASIKPTDPTIYNKLGATLANSGKSADAIQAYSQALKIFPNYVRALCNLGIGFSNQGIHQRAIETFLRTLLKNPQANHIWQYVSLSLVGMGHVDSLHLCNSRNIMALCKQFNVN